MTNYVLTFQSWRCQDGATIVPDKNGVPGYIQLRSKKRETYSRRLEVPDELIVTEFLNTGSSKLVRGMDLPSSEVSALCDFVSEYGTLTTAMDIGPLLKGIGVEDYPQGFTPYDGRRYNSWGANVYDLIGLRETLRDIWTPFEKGNVDEAVEAFDFFQGNNFTGDLSVEMRFHGGYPALMLNIAGLYTFMLMETALVMTGNCQIIRCVHCNNIFQTGSGTGRRSSASYCSNKCRVAAQRARKKPPAKRRKK